MSVVLKLDVFFQRITLLCGVLAGAAMVLLLFNVFYDVIMRYAFNDVSIGMQELEWHLFSCVFLLGTPYAMQRDGHVRVDIFYERWSNKTKAWINLGGAIFFVVPFIILVSYYGYGYTMESYDIGEGSGDPGGLPHRWIIKSLIPFSFVLMGLASLGTITKAIRVLLGEDQYDDSQKEHLS